MADDKILAVRKQIDDTFARYSSLSPSELATITRSRIRAGLPKATRDQLANEAIKDLIPTLSSLLQERALAQITRVRKPSVDPISQISQALAPTTPAPVPRYSPTPERTREDDNKSILDFAKRAGMDLRGFTLTEPGDEKRLRFRERFMDELPTTFPYYVQPRALFAHKPTLTGPRDEPLVVDEPAVSVFNEEQRKKLADTIVDRMLNYNRTSTYNVTDLVGIQARIIRNRGPQRVITVSKAYAGNCLVNIIKEKCELAGDSAEIMSKIYAAVPSLKPTDENPNPSIAPEDIETIARKLRCNIKVYSKLGALLNKPWKSFGAEKGRRFHVVFGDGHATVMPKKIKPDSIVYVRELDDPSNFTNVVNVGWVEHGEAPYSTIEFTHYITVGARPSAPGSLPSSSGEAEPLRSEHYTMYKTFRPSSISGNPDDDKDPAYAWCTTQSQLLTKIFRMRYNLVKMADPFIRDIVKASERFIGRRIFERISVLPSGSGVHTEIDMNKCYVSYKLNPYYTGFPTNDLYPIKGENERSQFYVCSLERAAMLPRSFAELYELTRGLPPGTSAVESGTSVELVLPKPVVSYLRSKGVDVKVLYTLVGDSADVDILGFTEENASKLKPEEIKRFRNELIGRCISGGMADTRKLVCEYSDEAEKEQLIHEAIEAGFKFYVGSAERLRSVPGSSPDASGVRGHVTVHVPTNPGGAFYFHSFILGYAMVSMCQQWDRLESLGAKIVGYNVDALLFSGAPDITTLGLGDEIGQWKISAPKPYYGQLLPNSPEPLRSAAVGEPEKQNERNAKIFDFRPFNDDAPVHTCINGAPGISKSYPFLAKPYYDQIFLTPTRALVDEHKATARKLGNECFPICTAHKYFQFGLNDFDWNTLRSRGSIPRRHKVVVIDERNMFDRDQWDIMVKRALADQSTIITMGDFEQISNNINAAAVDREYFDSSASPVPWKMVEMDRVRGAIARQTYQQGCILDSLRGETPEDQLAKICPYVESRAFELSPTLEPLQGTGGPRERVDFSVDVYITGNHKKTNEINLAVREFLRAPRSGSGERGEIPCVYGGSSEKKGKRIMLPVGDKKIWWGRTSMRSVMPKGFLYEPAFAVTADNVQGKTLEGKIYVDVANLVGREGPLYTAVTRCRDLGQLVFC